MIYDDMILLDAKESRLIGYKSTGYCDQEIVIENLILRVILYVEYS